MTLDGRQYAAVVVGGGQAGLAVSRCLSNRGVEHVVLERDTACHEWQDRRWDSFCLVTPNRQCVLPDFPYQGTDPDGFMVRDEVVRYLADYRAAFDFPLYEGVSVTGLRSTSGGFAVTTSAGTVSAAQVVVATGPYQVPRTPRFAERLPTSVRQLHSADYRNPAQLPGGEVLVVGTGQSGCQIAEDLHLAGRQVHLSVGGAPRVARRYRGRDVLTWLDEMGHYHRGIDTFDNAETVRLRANHYVTGRDGGRDIDLRAFARDGMRLYGRLTGFSGDAFTFAADLRTNLDHADEIAEGIKDLIDSHVTATGGNAPPEPRYTPVWEPSGEPDSLPSERIRSVIWCTGFARDYRWIDLPVFDGRGYPVHHRGVTSCHGLYFIGLPWQHTWGSGRFRGVGADAEYIAARIRAGAANIHWLAGMPKAA